MAVPSVGLSMIVKNGGEDLRHCLASVAGVVDQIVVADTGSTDGSCAVAREHGATVISFPWVNDFAAARNAALQPVTTDWVLILDADEELDYQAKPILHELTGDAGVGGWMATVRDYLPVRFGRLGGALSLENDGRHERSRNAPSFAINRSCRLFRRHPEIYYEGCVHEQVEMRIKAAGFGVRGSALLLHHFGQMAAEEARMKKYHFYHELSLLKVKEHPDWALAWMELALQEYEVSKNPEQALGYLIKCLQIDPTRTDAWNYLAMIQADLGYPEKVLIALEHAGPGNSQGALAMREALRGDALHDLGRFDEALAAFQKAIKHEPGNPLLHSKLGYTECRLGMTQQGIERMRSAAEAAPEVLEIHERLMKAYVSNWHLPEAAEVADGMAAQFRSVKMIIRAASIRAQLRQWQEARVLVERGLEDYPESPELHSVQGQINAALQALQSRS